MDLSEDLSLAADAKTRTRIAEAARGMLGCPFRHQGRHPITGVDCGGLCLVAGRLAGLPCPEGEVDYRRRPSMRDFSRSLPGIVVRVPGGLSEAEPGDALLIGVGPRLVPLHCAVVVARPGGPGSLPIHAVHSVEGQGVCLDVIDASRARHVLEVWRYRRPA